MGQSKQNKSKIKNKPKRYQDITCIWLYPGPLSAISTPKQTKQVPNKKQTQTISRYTIFCCIQDHYLPYQHQSKQNKSQIKNKPKRYQDIPFFVVSRTIICHINTKANKTSPK